MSTTVEFERVEPGRYQTVGLEPAYTVTREASTHGMKRASNPRWYVRRADTARHLAHRATLAEAQQYVRREVGR